MKAKALFNGTIGKGAAVRRVRVGDVFDLPEGTKPGKWMAILPDAAEPAPKAEKPKGKKEPATLSEIAKQVQAPKGTEDLV